MFLFFVFFKSTVILKMVLSILLVISIVFEILVSWKPYLLIAENVQKSRWIWDPSDNRVINS